VAFAENRTPTVAGNGLRTGAVMLMVLPPPLAPDVGVRVNVGVRM
jgi:hypothetical protein